MIQCVLAIGFWFPWLLNAASTSASSQLMYYWSLALRILCISLLVCEMSTAFQQSEHSLGLAWKVTFSSPVATAEFSKFADKFTKHQLFGTQTSECWVQHFNNILF